MEIISWFYKSYIQPQLEAQAEKEPIAFVFSSLENGLEPGYLQDYAQAKEFWATRAFLLGLRTGQGLSDASALLIQYILILLSHEFCQHLSPSPSMTNISEEYLIRVLNAS